MRDASREVWVVVRPEAGVRSKVKVRTGRGVEARGA
jgi:hypothetical protein